MLCYCYGSASDHFGPSAFNKFGFELLSSSSSRQPPSIQLRVINHSLLQTELHKLTSMESHRLQSSEFKYHCCVANVSAVSQVLTSLSLPVLSATVAVL